MMFQKFYQYRCRWCKDYLLALKLFKHVKWTFHCVTQSWNAFKCGWIQSASNFLKKTNKLPDLVTSVSTLVLRRWFSYRVLSCSICASVKYPQQPYSEVSNFPTLNYSVYSSFFFNSFQYDVSFLIRAVWGISSIRRAKTTFRIIRDNWMLR